MNTNKLANLLGRLEGYVQNIENSPQDPNELVDKLESLLNRLENAQGHQGQVIAKAQNVVASSGSVASSPAPVSAVSSGGNALVSIFKEKCFKNVKALLDCTKDDIKNEHLVEGVNIYLDMLNKQEAVLKTMEKCKKPADTQFLVNMAKDNKATLFKLGKPGRAVGTHLRCIEDSVNIFVWFMCSE
jgi:hypothetical protein